MIDLKTSADPHCTHLKYRLEDHYFFNSTYLAIKFRDLACQNAMKNTIYANPCFRASSLVIKEVFCFSEHSLIAKEKQ